MSVCASVRRTFSEERGPGAFHPLGHLPRRKQDAPQRKPPVFHFPHDDDDDDHSSSFDERPQPPANLNVPFPRATSPQSPSFPRSPSSPSSFTPRPNSPSSQLLRGASAPILLSNGKPLKSSLKSSASSPSMLTPLTHTHLRARSAPTSPVATPKNVHFPEKDYGLATVRVYNRSARPAALNNPLNGNGDETETDGEEQPLSRFPFPSMPPAIKYEIDPTKSSPVPGKISPHTNLLLESLDLAPSSSSTMAAKPFLTGSVLVRNLAFEKHVAIRFTLDDWQTVSEVSARYVDSPSILPSHLRSLVSPFTSDDTTLQRGRGWDRFAFTIRLEDYAQSLSTRTLWLASRYRVNSTYPDSDLAQHGPGGEWWDNNGGANHRVGFRAAVVTSPSPRGRPRRETVSAPITPRQTQPHPPITNEEHALGLMLPSVPDRTIQPINVAERRSMLLRVGAGKLNLCNYVPPTVRVTSSVSVPPAGSPTTSSASPIISSQSPSSATLRSSCDEDSSSPVSSTLSTPSESPTMTPRVIIGGQPATSTSLDGGSEKDEDEFRVRAPRPGHIADWDWTAPVKPRIEGLTRERVDFVPVSAPPMLLGGENFADSNSLYNAFVTQWCFAQGPSPNQGYGDGGIMA
ncbi:carbohydrate-binding module family 21 protein [Chiua virens]|nr:carbohydrate-binding module family 21 protein [Chiua virens]